MFRRSPPFKAAFAALLGCLFILTLDGCGGSAPAPVDDPAARIKVEDLFLRFRLRIQEGHADSLASYLSRESLNWLDDMRRASRTEPQAYLEERPFYEILSILALRVERRLNPTFDDRPAGLLDKLVLQAYPVRKTFLKTDLGEAHIFGDRAEMGLREAPNVPVFHFTKENGIWKFHLTRSLPLILQGAESLARQRKSTHLLQAIFVLEQFGGRTVLPEDLRR
jgi:hypothetical protein